MNDITERLRFMGDNEPGCDPSITEEAAKEIERLREALREIGNGNFCMITASIPPICSRALAARAALKENDQ